MRCASQIFFEFILQQKTKRKAPAGKNSKFVYMSKTELLDHLRRQAHVRRVGRDLAARIPVRLRQLVLLHGDPVAAVQLGKEAKSSVSVNTHGCDL